MSEDINIEQIIQKYKNKFNPAVKDAFNNIKNSKQFNDHFEYLELETAFDELIYLTSYETFGRIDESISTPEMDNKANYMKFRYVVNKMSEVLNKVKINLEKCISILSSKDIKTTDLKMQIESYRLTSALSNLQKVSDEIKSFTNYFDAAKALLSFPYFGDVNYDPKSLDLKTIQNILEKKEKEKIKVNLSRILKEQQPQKDQEKKEVVEHKIISNKKDDEIDLSKIVVFCGSQSSQDTLTSKEQYFDAIKKLIKKIFEDIKSKTFILPKFYYILKDFVFQRIKLLVEEKQILYLINEDGEKLIPWKLIQQQIEEFFNQNTKPYLPTTNDYNEQAKRIKDSIFFEIAAIENSYSRRLSVLDLEEKKNLIISKFKPEIIALYRFLLPPQQKIEEIVEAYLKTK